MFNLDKQTRVDKVIFKKNFQFTKSQEEAFKRDIIRVKLSNIINSRKTAITQLEDSHEICIFTIDLKEKKIPKDIIKAINNSINQLNIFVLRHNNSFCYYINDFISIWDEDIQFNFTGINTLVIYENCIKAIAKESSNLSLEQLEKKKELEEQITKLETKKNREKQMNRKKEIREQIIKLKKEIIEL